MKNEQIFVFIAFEIVWQSFIIKFLTIFYFLLTEELFLLS